MVRTMMCPATALADRSRESQAVRAARDRPESPDVPDEELAVRSRAGDLEAFSVLVERHTSRLFNLLRQWAGCPEDAEDLAQETFLRAYRSIGRFNPNRPFLPWLFAIARRATASHHRRMYRREAVEGFVDESVSVADPAGSLVSAEEAAALWREARRLKPKQFQALWLFYAEGFPVIDVARVLGTTSIHAKVLLHRARAALASRLTGVVAGPKTGERVVARRSSS